MNVYEARTTKGLQERRTGQIPSPGSLSDHTRRLRDLRRVQNHYEESPGISGWLEDREDEYRLLLGLSSDFTKIGWWDSSIEVLESALLIARDLKDKSREAMVLMRLGHVCLESRGGRGAIGYYTDAMRIYHETGGRRGEAQTLVAIGHVHYRQHGWRDAAEFFNVALQIFVKAGDQRSQASTLTMLGETHRHLREYGSAVKLLRDAMEIHKRLGDWRSAAMTLAAIANVYAELDRKPESLKRFELASQVFKELGDSRSAAVMMMRQSAILKDQSCHKEAIEIAEAAVKIFTGLDDPAAANLREQIGTWQRGQAGFVEAKPLGPATKPASDPALITFTYETVTLDERGRVKKRRTLTARQFIEEIAPGVYLEMVEIPGGAFMMGAPMDEECSLKCERPQRKVTVSPFYIGKFTVTQAQWRVVASWPKVGRNLDPGPSRFKGDNRPVERVSWFDAEEFCVRLTKKTGREWRLPTEAEWEYACRSGAATPFAFGKTMTHEIVNYHSEYPYAKAKKQEPRNMTVPVGSLGVANAFGLFDMHGNTQEWCRDWYGEYPGAPRNDPAGPEKGTCRVLRGGSWQVNGYSCRSADRVGNLPEIMSEDVSFRIVVEPSTK